MFISGRGISLASFLAFVGLDRNGSCDQEADEGKRPESLQSISACERLLFEVGCQLRVIELTLIVTVISQRAYTSSSRHW